MALDGILVIDKPAGWTSHDVVAKVRGITRQRRIGHTGTLDPMATGVLVLCLGQATRLVEYMITHDKRYEGELVLGATTDTDDAEGNVLEQRTVPAIDDAVLRRLETEFSGNLLQRPPAVSALKVDGKRAYALARAGKPADLPPRPVVVHKLTLAQLAPGRLSIGVHCGPGTYIRSLARDIGERLGCGGHLGSLRRTSAGGFGIGDALTLDKLAACVARGELEEHLLPPDEGIWDFEAAILTAEHCLRLGQGAVLRDIDPPVSGVEVARIYDATGSFVGLGSVAENGEIRALKVMNLAKPAEFV